MWHTVKHTNAHTHSPWPSTRTVPSDRYQGQYAAQKLIEQGVKKVVVAYSDGSYGQGLAFSFIAAFTKDGGQAFPVPMELGGRNISAIIAEVNKVQPDGLFIASNEVLWGAGECRGVGRGWGPDVWGLRCEAHEVLRPLLLVTLHVLQLHPPHMQPPTHLNTRSSLYPPNHRTTHPPTLPSTHPPS